MADYKQHVVFTEGWKTVKKASLFSKAVEIKGYMPVKAINFQPKKFYTELELDELKDMGVTYEIKY